MRTLLDILTEAARRGQGNFRTIVGVVSRVNDDRTVDVAPLNGESEVLGVRTQASPGLEGGWVLLPAPGSLVMCTFLSDEEAIVSMTSEVTEIEGKVGDFQVKISEAGVELNGGRWKELETEINTIKSLFNSLQTVFNAWVPVPMDGGLALKALITSFTSQPLPTTDSLNNPSVK